MAATEQVKITPDQKAWLIARMTTSNNSIWRVLEDVIEKMEVYDMYIKAMNNDSMIDDGR